MRRFYSTFLLIIAGLLVIAATGTSLAASLNHSQAAISGASAAAATVASGGGETKSPPPTDRPAQPANSNGTNTVCLEPVVNVSATTGNHAESQIVINPTNPQNLVAFSNITSNSTFRGYSNDGGATWTRGNILPGIACCDAQAVFDRFGTLFMVYINGSVNQINVIASTDGGATFTTPLTVGTGSIDQPSIAVGQNSVWVDWNQSGSMRVRGAPITGLGVFGPFGATQTPPSATGSFGGIAVGPNDVPIIVYQDPTGGQGPATIYANVDADGLGAGNFGPKITVTTTNVGGFDFIPAQSGRSIDAEAGVVWDYTGNAFNGRIYLVYTEEPIAENNDTEIYVRTSTDSGSTWSAPVRVNDDPLGTIRSQFLPYITLDRSTGVVAVGFHDARNDNGVPGSGGTNSVANDDSEYYATYTTDGGATWAANKRLSGGFSNDNAAGNGVDYGDYVAADAYGGKFVGMWADNANCDGTNPDGTLHAFDLYTGVMNLPGGGPTPTPTNTGVVPTNTSTPTRTSTATTAPTNTPTSTSVPPTATNTSVVPSATSTNTPVGPTNTRTNTPAVPTATSTNTSVPGTPTSTATGTISTPTSTNTAGVPTATATVCTITFSDVPPGSTFYTWIRCLACLGIVNGYPDGTFHPENNVTRGQLAKIVSNSAGFLDPATTQQYADVPVGSTFFDYIYRLTIRGYINGYACGGPGETCGPGNLPYFRPANSATRGQISKIVSNAAGFSEPAGAQQFQDVLPGSTFYDFIWRLTDRGVMNGYVCGGIGEPCVAPGNLPYFRPSANATRGQTSKIVANTFFPDCQPNR